MHEDLTKWKRCKRCNLHILRKNVVLGKGSLPCDVLFIADAPGKSDDLRAEPFVGPSGKLLRLAINTALRLARTPLDQAPSIYIMYCVGCRPCNEPLGLNREPTGEELWACFQRFAEEAKLARPKQVAFLGKIAAKNCRERFPAGRALQHPGYIRQQGGANSAAYTQFVRELSEVFRLCQPRSHSRTK